MTGLGRVVRAGVRRRRVPSVVIGLVVLLAVTSAVLGASLLVASSGPFDRAFAAQRGAHLAAEYDASRADRARVAATARANGVTASAGPFAIASVTPRVLGGGALGGLGQLPPMTLAERADPGGAVDALTLTAGRWVSGPGEVVLSADAGYLPVGTVLTVPGMPPLTVVGLARSVTRSADGWVEPGVLASPTGYQMLYRFAAAATDAQVSADRAALVAAGGLPAGALAGSTSWLSERQADSQNVGVFLPFLAAFGVLGLVMSVLIVVNVVAGAVGQATWRIGVLKAMGYTPGQVVRAYVAQALVPAGVGAVLGVAAGNALAVPVLSQTNAVYGSSTSGVAPWTDVTAAAGMLAVVAGTAWLAAARAGRLRTVDALAVGRVPAAGRGRWAARLAALLPVPRPLGLGLAHPFARPARASGLLAAVGFGAVTVTFALGLGSTILDVQSAKNHGGDVLVGTGTAPYGGHFVARPGSAPSSAATPAPSAAAIRAAIAAQPGTAAFYGEAETKAGVVGVSGSTDVYAFTGDTAFTGNQAFAGYQMVSGSWFHGAGQAVAVRTFLTATGTRIGDTVTLLYQGHPVPVRIVGEVFDPHSEPELLVDGATLPGTDPDAYHVKLRPGTDSAAYQSALRSALGTSVMVSADESGGHSGTLLALGSLTILLTVMLVLTAALGVLNTVVLDVRDRVHEIGVYKALGMTPRQSVAMVLGSVVLTGLAGGLVGVPVGYLVHAGTAPAMGRASGLVLPVQALHVYHPVELAVLVAGGVAIAVLGALLPAGWAARVRTTTALRAE